MSLQLRLKLNGNLDNTGINLSNITNTGATIDNNGINGTCYYFNGSNSYITISNINSIFKGGNTPFSISFWFYHSGNKRRGVLFGNYGLADSNRFNLEIKADNTFRFWWDGSPDWTISSFTIPTQTWIHCTIVYTGTQVKIYKNNQQVYSTTYTLSTKNPTTSYRLGMDSRTGATAFNGKINDFRIYNHALSLKEITEIYNSINLICHYPLNDPYLFVQTNIVNSINVNNPRVEKIENGVKFLTTSGDAYFELSLKSTLQSTNKYVLSYWCDIQSGDSCQFGFYYSSKMNHIHTVKNGLNVIVFQPTTNLPSISFVDSGRSNSHEFTLTNIKIESYNETLGNYATPYGSQSNEVYDCVNNNNGIMDGTPIILPVNKKYKYCTKFTGSQYIVSSNELVSTPKSFSFWIQVDTQPTTSQIVFADGKSKLAFGFYTNGTKVISGAGVSRQVQSLDNKFIYGSYWNHVIVQANDTTSNVEVYVNGTKLTNTSDTNNWSHIVNYLYIGARNNGSASAFGTFAIQDFRVYNKMLSQDEINELIHIPINLDNKGNLFLSEINEMQYSNKVSFNQYGQIISKNIVEDNMSGKQASITKSGNIIINQVIEK